MMMKLALLYIICLVSTINCETQEIRSFLEIPLTVQDLNSAPWNLGNRIIPIQIEFRTKSGSAGRSFSFTNRPIIFTAIVPPLYLNEKEVVDVVTSIPDLNDPSRLLVVARQRFMYRPFDSLDHAQFHGSLDHLRRIDPLINNYLSIDHLKNALISEWTETKSEMNGVIAENVLSLFMIRSLQSAQEQKSCQQSLMNCPVFNIGSFLPSRKLKNIRKLLKLADASPDVCCQLRKLDSTVLSSCQLHPLANSPAFIAVEKLLHHGTRLCAQLSLIFSGSLKPYQQLKIATANTVNSASCLVARLVFGLVPYS